jgi:phage terminase large subunit-like protein
VVSQGFLQTTPGSTVTYEYVAQHLKRVFDTHRAQKIAFDRWNMPFLKAWLLSAEFSEQLIADK